MGDCSDEHTDESHELPFTFPQVKPLYSSLRKISSSRYSSRRKPLQPLKCFTPRESEENAHSGNQAENDSILANSISGELTPYCNIESSTRLEQNENFRHLDLFPPHCSGLRTPFSGRPLVKRVPKTCFTLEKKKIEESDIHCVKGSKPMQKPVDKITNENLVKTNEKQDELHGENLGKNNSNNNINGRILRNIVNYNHEVNAKKSIDTVKLTEDSKCVNANNKGVFVMPSIAYQKESGVADVPRKTPKAPNKMTPAIDKNSKSGVILYRKENLELLAKPKSQQAIFKEPEVEKPKETRFNPSMCRQREPKLLHVNNVQYSVLSKFGQGGSSQVYQVLDTRTSSLVAVKCVNLVDADEVTAMGYLKEIEMLSKLQNSNRVIQLIDHEYLKQQQILYVVMEKGDTDLSTLLKLMAKSGDVSLPMIIYYWTEMLHAVKEIHTHGIVHADLKPANFLLVCGRLKLIDFGIASAIQNDATSVFKNSMHGTCNYMSPEAIQDPGDSSRTKVGYKSDVWSLGCILYNLLYRKTPFQHITNNLRKLQVIASPNHSIEFPPVEKCPPPLMTALKRCLIYNAKKRPTVAELLVIDYIWPSNE